MCYLDEYALRKRWILGRLSSTETKVLRIVRMYDKRQIRQIRKYVISNKRKVAHNTGIDKSMVF